MFKYNEIHKWTSLGQTLLSDKVGYIRGLCDSVNVGIQIQLLLCTILGLFSDNGSLTTEAHGYYGSTRTAAEPTGRCCHLNNDEDEVSISRRSTEHPYQRPSVGPLPLPPPPSSSATPSSAAAAARYLQLNCVSCSDSRGQQPTAAALQRWNSSTASSAMWQWPIYLTHARAWKRKMGPGVTVKIYSLQ